MDQHVSKAFDAAQDASKQMITIAAGIVALTITFFSDFGEHAPHGAKELFAIAWIAYAVSILFGIFTVQTLAGNLQHNNLTIYRVNTIIFSIIQIVTFLAGLGCTIAAGWRIWF